MMDNTRFFLCSYFSVQVYAWLTPAQAHGHETEEEVAVFEDRAGQMVMYGALAGDLVVQAAV